jgi:hypothetical protein
MGVAEIVIFAVSWLVVASLMLWGVFTERNRDGLGLGRRSRRAERAGQSAPPTEPTGRPPRVAHTDWIVLESAAGSGPEVEAQARLIASALLASRGVDLEQLPPGDLRTEVTTSTDGAGTTRVLVKAGAMHASRRHR